MSDTSDPSVALHVDWLRVGGAPLLHTSGRVGLSTCPGRPDLGSDLAMDLEVLARLQIRTVLSLVEEEEMRVYGVSGLAEALGGAGIRHLRLPVVDGQPPADLQQVRALCLQVLGLLGEGESVLVHCIGGWGRSGTLAAALLCHEGHSASTAIRLVRGARSPRCIETMAQELFVQRYAREQGQHHRRYHLVPLRELPERLSGTFGARLYQPGGDEGLAFVPGEALPRALLKAHRLREPMVALSGELPIEGPLLRDTLPVDRAYHVDGDGLLPVRFGSLAP